MSSACTVVGAELVEAAQQHVAGCVPIDEGEDREPGGVEEGYHVVVCGDGPRDRLHGCPIWSGWRCGSPRTWRWTPEFWRSRLTGAGLRPASGWCAGKSRVPGGGSGSAAGCGSGWDQTELDPMTGRETGAVVGARGFPWGLGRGRRGVSSRRRGSGLLRSILDSCVVPRWLVHAGSAAPATWSSVGDTWRNTRHELDRLHLVTLATDHGRVAQRRAHRRAQEHLRHARAGRTCPLLRLHHHRRLTGPSGVPLPRRVVTRPQLVRSGVSPAHCPNSA